jgi:hypothetical protein
VPPGHADTPVPPGHADTPVPPGHADTPVPPGHADTPVPPGQDLDAFADAAAGLVEHWLTAGRERQLARYELALEATRRPELREALVAAGARIRAVVAGQFAAAGIREPRSRAADFAAFLDGLLFDQIAGAGARELTGADLRAVIGTLLAAVARS